MSFWFAAYVPANTPPAVVNRLHDILVEATKGPAMQQYYSDDRHRSVRDDAGRARQVPGGGVGEVEGHHQEGGHRAGVSGSAPRTTPCAPSLRLGGGAGFAGDRLDAPVAARRARRARLPGPRMPRRAHDRARAAAPAARSGERLRRAAGRNASSRCCRCSQRTRRSPRQQPRRGQSRWPRRDAIVAIARRLRIPVKVAAVTGDDVLDALDLDAPTMEVGPAAVALRADRVGQRVSRRRGDAAGARQRRRHRHHRPRRRSVAVRRAAHARVRLGARRRRPPRARHRGRAPARMRGAAVRRLLRRPGPQGRSRHGARWAFRSPTSTPDGDATLGKVDGTGGRHHASPPRPSSCSTR